MYTICTYGNIILKRLCTRADSKGEEKMSTFSWSAEPTQSLTAHTCPMIYEYVIGTPNYLSDEKLKGNDQIRVR
jgi:hypothetical protein